MFRSDTDHSDHNIVYGTHSVHYAVKHRPDDVRRIYIDRDHKRRFGVIVKLARQKKIPVEEVDDAQLHQLSAGGVHQGVVARYVDGSSELTIDALCDDLSRGRQSPLVLVLDRLSDPGNLGACLRSAAAFGVDGVVITRHHSAPLNALARKAAAGAAECLSVVSVGSLQHALETLRKLPGMRLVATGAEPNEQTQAPYEANWHHSGITLVMGGEQGGVRPSVMKACHATVCIPMSDRMDCLNVSAACAVLLYEIQRQRRSE